MNLTVRKFVCQTTVNPTSCPAAALCAIHNSMLQGHFTSRTSIEPAGPGRCRHILDQTIE